jgi:hypothetical protein
MGYARFCFLCSTWLKGEESWKAHCEDHIAEQAIPIRCNPVTYRHAIACAGYCPVHLGRIDLPANARMRQWSDQDAWKRHIAQCFSAHLIQQRGLKTIACPHPKCPMEFLSEKDFWYHQNDIHSIFEKATAVGKRKSDLNESHYISEDSRKSKRVDLEQPIGLKLIPFMPENESLTPKQQYDSGYTQNQDSYSVRDSPGTSPDSSFGVCGQPEDEEMHAFLTCLGGSSCRSGDELRTSSPGLGRMNETLLAELPASGMDEASVLVDPLLVSGGEIATTCNPESLTTPDTMAMEATDKELSHSDTITLYQQDLLGEEAYSVDCLLGRWGKDLFYLRWLDGSYGWEPRENILDEDLIRQFEESYQGFKEGVEVLRTRIRNGKVEYRLHWDGRPKSENWWVAEKDLHPELIEEYKPRKKGQVKRRRRIR